MGNSISHDLSKSFEKLNTIVTSIVNEKDVFKNRDYNFLSEDVCNNHYLVMENELNRHLKVTLNNLGTNLYLIPKDHDKKHGNKGELCRRISKHYMKILYLLCLIKYVYNLERHGEFSISGIIFRNIRVDGNLMELNFCNVAHKDFSRSLKDAHKLDFGKLEGLKFLTQFFLDKSESYAFIHAMRRVLARSPKRVVGDTFCEMSQGASPAHVRELEAVYSHRYNEKLVCRGRHMDPKADKAPNLFMFVEKDNPILSKEFCNEKHKFVYEIHSPGGRKMLEMYKKMRKNHDAHLDKVAGLLDLLVFKEHDGTFTLKDINQRTLHGIIKNVKESIKSYYIQSLLDFHKLLDVGKNTPNINISR